MYRYRCRYWRRRSLIPSNYYDSSHGPRLSPRDLTLALVHQSRACRQPNLNKCTSLHPSLYRSRRCFSIVVVYFLLLSPPSHFPSPTADFIPS